MADEAVVLRSEAVRERIMQIRGDLVERSLELGRLLREARDQNYNLSWGFARFGDWVEEASGLDMSARSAYYLITIIERSEALQITDEQLKRVKRSKLDEIFSLKAAEPEVIKELLVKAETAPLSEIKRDVKLIRIAGGEDPYTHLNIKLPVFVNENTVQPAFEKARRMAGTNTNESGEAVDIPDWRCLEACAASLLNEPEEAPSEVIDAQFEDIAEIYIDQNKVEG